MAPGASLVCSVENTRWPVSAAWMAISRRLQVADLADHDDVGVLAHDGAQPAGEGEPDLAACTWIWLMPSSWYSTGSSTVMIFTSGVLILSSAA